MIPYILVGFVISFNFVRSSNTHSCLYDKILQAVRYGIYGG